MADDAESEDVQEDSEESEDILATARKRFQIAAEAESDFRRDALEDLQFSLGEQWPQEVKNQRYLDQRPCLVINRIPQFVRQITNDQRQNRPSIKVSPVDDDADVETAKIIQGMVRHIETSSSADIAYDTAFEYAVRTGRGFFRILTDYCDPMSFDQDLIVKRIPNPFTCYMDPMAREPDGSDMNWAFIVEDMLQDDYVAQYPKSKVASLNDFSSIGDQTAEWFPGNRVRVAEYFYKEMKDVEIVLLSDGIVMTADNLPKVLPESIKEFNRRKTQVPVIKWCKINGEEILEQRDWVGKWIPLIPVYGEELDVNGKQVLQGLVRNAKDSQRMINYWASAETEAIALAPKAPYIGVEGQFEGHEEMWRTSNLKNHPFLQYKPVGLNGQMAPPPQRNVAEPAVQAITLARNQAVEDLKATTGIYDPSLGQRMADQSGIAIKRLTAQSQTSNFHFLDNLTRSLKHAGRIMVDAIPKVYDTERAVRVLHPDDTEEVALINQEFTKDGKATTYSMDIGTYDVVMETGPSYATKRAESVASMMDLTKSYPQIMQIAGDLLVKNMDWPGAQEIAQRMQKVLPPQLQDQKNKPQIPPQAQAQMQQMGDMIQKLSAEVHKAHDRIESKSLELESKERIALQNNQTQAEIALAKIGSDRDREMLRIESARIESLLDKAHQMGTQANDFANQAQLSDLSNLAAGPNGASPIAPTGGLPPGQPMGTQP